MAGAVSGVQKRIRDIQRKAHCAGHGLNLVIVNSCTVPEISNCIDHITLWIKHSPKQEELLKKVYYSSV